MGELKFEYEEGDTPFGIFHPTGYIIAAFESLDIAKQAAEELLKSDFESDKVQAASASQVKNSIEQGHPADSTFEKLKQTLSKTLGSEGFFWDEDLRLAEQGAGFISLYCSDGEQARAAAAILSKFSPLSMRRYRSFAIEDLMQNATPE